MLLPKTSSSSLLTLLVGISKTRRSSSPGAFDAPLRVSVEAFSHSALGDGLGPAWRQGCPFGRPKNGNARPLRPRPRAGRESIDADQLTRVKLAASATGAVDRAPAFDVKATDLSFCAVPKDADRTYVKRDPIVIWQSVVAFALGNRKVPNGGNIHWPSGLSAPFTLKRGR